MGQACARQGSLYIYYLKYLSSCGGEKVHDAGCICALLSVSRSNVESFSCSGEASSSKTLDLVKRKTKPYLGRKEKGQSWKILRRVEFFLFSFLDVSGHMILTLGLIGS